MVCMRRLTFDNMRFFRDSVNGNYDTLHPNEFPHIFATCRGLDPHPQFQIVRVERMRGYDEYAVYRFINVEVENTEWNILHNGNPEESLMGQMTVYRPGNNPNEIALRVRFQIRNIYLVSNQESFPIVMLDTFDVLPRANLLILPSNTHHNTQQNYNFPRGDPNFTTHYLMDRENIYNPTLGLTNRVIDQLDRMRARRFNRDNDRDWYDSIPHPDVYADEYHNRDRFRSPERYNDDFIPFHAVGAGAPRGSRQRSTRRSPPRTPPRQPTNVVWGGEPRPVPPVPMPATMPVTLQAFTIQALINHAISEHMTCPISMNPIDKDSACITSCQHIFERDSIQHWLSDHTNCPVCRQATHICN
jgi:hypothetical protein